MIKIHDRDLRGRTKTGWLDSQHTFSFGHFRDPNRIRFRSLRVINDDVVIPGAGFDMHSHDNMEIITYVMEGALAHKDSLGNGSTIRPMEIQRMSAGSGIAHSEFNASNDDKVHLLQIWIMPEARNLEPGYEQQAIDPEKVKGRFHLIGDRKGTDGAVTIHQDVKLYLAQVKEGQSVSYDFAPGRGGFVQVTRGRVALNGEDLKEGDGAEITDVPCVSFTTQADSEIMLFDLK